jgi:hypothetical protein
MEVVSHSWNMPWQSQLSSLKTNITNVKLILIFLGILEEFRDLSVVEWKFRIMLQEKYNSLTQQQMIYWKQKGTIKWVKLGNEGTKIFHANATIRQRRNLIISLKDANDLPHSNHPTKANILWESFKDRLGTTDNPDMSFNYKIYYRGLRIWIS